MSDQPTFQLTANEAGRVLEALGLPKTTGFRNNVDHACARCVGDEEMVQPGFVCLRHRLIDWTSAVNERPMEVSTPPIPDVELMALAAIVQHDAAMGYANAQQYGQLMSQPDYDAMKRLRVELERRRVLGQLR